MNRRPARKIEAHLANQIRDGQRDGYAAGALPATGLGRLYVARHLLDNGWTPPETLKPLSPFRQRADTLVEETAPWSILVFIVLLVINAASEVTDGVHGLADWLAVVSLVLFVPLPILFGWKLLRARRRRRR